MSDTSSSSLPVVVMKKKKKLEEMVKDSEYLKAGEEPATIWERVDFSAENI